MPTLTPTKPPPPAPTKLPVPAAPARKPWDQVLREAGYPTTVLVIDFETYFDETYGMGDKLSTIEYVQDARFEVLGVAAGNPYLGFHWIEGEAAVYEYLEEQVKCWDGQITVLAQNLAFDALILSRRFGIHPKYMIDLLGLARHQNARQKNDLGSLCAQYKLKAKGETAEFKGATFRTDRFRKPKRGPKMPVKIEPMDPAKAAALKEYAINDVEREWELFTLLLPKLSNPATELRLIQHTIELFTRPTLRVDFDKGADIARRMDANIDAALPPGMSREDVSGNKTFEAALVAALGDEAGQYLKQCKVTAARPTGEMMALAKADEEREELLNHPNPAVKALMQARVAVKSWPLHIARVNRIMAQAKADGGRLPVPLKYHGAHTGRAAGGEKINLQNLGSRGDKLVSEVRQMVVAPPDHELVIVDAAQIEARVLAWIAGQWDLMERFAKNEEIYCGLATKISGKPCRKPNRKGSHIPAVEDYHERLRGLGKVGVLGCGYGMGKRAALAYANNPPYLLGITQETADRIVDTYRAENKEIVKFWYALEKAFRYTARYHQPCAMDRGLSFRSDPDCDVVIVLPNGRELHYPHVRVKTEYDGHTTVEVFNQMTKSWEHTWGGTLTENVVQAMSRDVLMEAMLRLEDQGFHTALHVHDELVIVVRKDAGTVAKSVAVAELSRVPVWAPRLALAAEGAISERYGKH